MRVGAPTRAIPGRRDDTGGRMLSAHSAASAGRRASGPCVRVPARGSAQAAVRAGRREQPWRGGCRRRGVDANCGGRLGQTGGTGRAGVRAPRTGRRRRLWPSGRARASVGRWIGARGRARWAERAAVRVGPVRAAQGRRDGAGSRTRSAHRAASAGRSASGPFACERQRADRHRCPYALSALGGTSSRDAGGRARRGTNASTAGQAGRRSSP